MTTNLENRRPAVRQTTRKTLVTDVRLNGVPINSGQVSSLTLTMSSGEHDDVLMTVVAPKVVAYSSAAKQLLSFRWGHELLGRFYGYVTSVTPKQMAARRNVTYQIRAQGPTFVMKTGRPRFFTDTTVGDVFAQICREHKLGFNDEYGKQHYRWRQLAQTDESDWSFLNMLAERVGAVAVCSEGVVRLLDPMNVLVRYRPIEYLSRDFDAATPTVYDFIPTHYTDRLPTQYSPTVGYLSGGKAVVYSSTPTGAPSSPPSYFDANRPVFNSAEAQLAQIRLPVTWEEQGTVRLQGSTAIEPGAVLFLRTNVVTTRSLSYDGHWYVVSATHSLNPDTYQTQVDMARVTDAYRLSALPARQWYLDPRGRPQLIPDASGVWASTWR